MSDSESEDIQMRNLRRQNGQHAINMNNRTLGCFSRQNSTRRDYARAISKRSSKKFTVPLLQAAEDNEPEKCKTLIRKGAYIDKKDEETGSTALHVAAQKDHVKIIRELLKNADCNARNKRMQTALHIAVEKAHDHICKLLLDEQSLDINAADEMQETPLHYAVKHERYEICRNILARNDLNINAKNNEGLTPLHYAAMGNSSEILSLLLANKANWLAKDNNLYLPLHYAASKGKTECCKELKIKHTADVQQTLASRSYAGKTPLMLAAEGGHDSCCEILKSCAINYKDVDGNTALHFAALFGLHSVIKLLLDAKADPNIRNNAGRTPVVETARVNSFKCMQTLATNGANLDETDNDGKSVMHYAAEANAIETLRYLLAETDLKERIDRKDKTFYTPLHLALNAGADACALLLLNNNASPTEPCSNENMTPLHLAAHRGNASICECLLAKEEVQVSYENMFRETPLHLAAQSGATDACHILIQKGARLSAVDKKGRTALHVAAAKGNTNVVKYLARRGIKVEVVDDEGCCALHLAAFQGSLECCQVLVSWAKETCWKKDSNRDLPLDRAFNLKRDDVFEFLVKNLDFKENTDQILRTHEYMQIAVKENRLLVIEAIVDSCWWNYGFIGESGKHSDNYHSLINSYPTVALKLQDKCIKRSSDKTTHNFFLLEDDFYIPSAVEKQPAKSPFHPYTHQVLPEALTYAEDGLEWKNLHSLTLMISHQRHELLQHPLVKAWLWQRWDSSICYIFLALLAIELLFAMSLGGFMVITYNWMHVEKVFNLTEEAFCNISKFMNATSFPEEEVVNGTLPNVTESDITSMETSDVVFLYQENLVWRHGLWIAVCILTSVSILLEFNYLYRLKKVYIFQTEHLVQILIIILTLATIIPGGTCEFYNMIIDVGQWQCGVIGVLLISLRLVNTLNKLPMLSVFMPVTPSFAKSFIKVTCYIILILFFFAFVFHLLLRDQDPFLSIPQALVKSIVWMLGDLGYDDIFLSEDNELYYPWLTNCIFLIFVTTLGGFFSNLIVSQPAEKLDIFREKAAFHKAASRTNLFLKLDICFPIFHNRRAVGSYVDGDSNPSRCRGFLKKLLMLDIGDGVLQMDAQDPIQRQLEELSKQNASLALQMSELREEMTALRSYT